MLSDRAQSPASTTYSELENLRTPSVADRAIVTHHSRHMSVTSRARSHVSQTSRMTKHSQRSGCSSVANKLADNMMQITQQLRDDAAMRERLALQDKQLLMREIAEREQLQAELNKHERDRQVVLEQEKLKAVERQRERERQRAAADVKEERERITAEMQKQIELVQKLAEAQKHVAMLELQRTTEKEQYEMKMELLKERQRAEELKNKNESEKRHSERELIHIDESGNESTGVLFSAAKHQEGINPQHIPGMDAIPLVVSLSEGGIDTHHVAPILLAPNNITQTRDAELRATVNSMPTQNPHQLLGVIQANDKNTQDKLEAVSFTNISATMSASKLHGGSSVASNKTLVSGPQESFVRGLHSNVVSGLQEHVGVSVADSRICGAVIDKTHTQMIPAMPRLNSSVTIMPSFSTPVMSACINPETKQACDERVTGLTVCTNMPTSTSSITCVGTNIPTILSDLPLLPTFEPLPMHITPIGTSVQQVNSAPTTVTQVATSTAATVVSTESVANPVVGTQPAIPTAPIVVVREFEKVKPYTGESSHKSFKEHFLRVARANGWTTKADKVQHLSLALDKAAADVLKEIDEEAEDAYEQIWAALARRFGHTDEPQRAMRKFDVRKQNDGETVVQFELALRTLYREAWPNADPGLKDSALKRKFEEGLSSPEMAQFLRLHARDDDFAQTVAKARQFVDAQEVNKPKKAVRIVTAPEHGNYQESFSGEPPNFQPLLDGFQKVIERVLEDRAHTSHVGCMASTKNFGGSNAQASGRRNQSPARRVSSPATRERFPGNGNQTPEGQRPTIRFQDQQRGGRSPSPGLWRQFSGNQQGQQQESQRRSSGEFRRGFSGVQGSSDNGFRNRAPVFGNHQRYSQERRGQRFPPRNDYESGRTSAPRDQEDWPQGYSDGGRQRQDSRGWIGGQSGDRPQDVDGRRFQPREWSANSPSRGRGNRQPRRWQDTPPGDNRRPPSRDGSAPPDSGSRRVPRGCHICGRVGCHTDFHSLWEDVPGYGPPRSTDSQNQPSVPVLDQGNNQRGPLQGDRTPLAVSRPHSN